MENLIGQKFGRLTVISDTFKLPNVNGTNVYYVTCECDCGNIINVVKDTIKRGVTKSCGCYKYDIKNNKDIANKRLLSTTENIINRRFGNLVVIEYTGRFIDNIGINRGAGWLCRCDCGKTKIVAANNLKSGRSKSCGCRYKKPK